MHDAGERAGNRIVLEEKKENRMVSGEMNIEGRHSMPEKWTKACEAGRASRILSGKMDEASSARIPAGTGHSLGNEKKRMILHECTMRGKYKLLY